MQTPSDLTLLQQWQHHQDAHAFKALTQRYGALVFGICNRVLKNPADAEEITQDCFLKLAQDPGKVGHSVGPWLHSVAVNAAISRIRSEQRRRAREAIHESARAQSTEYSARDLFEHVDEAISQLPDAQRHCVVGYFLEGKPRREVAAELAISTKSVQRRTDEAIEEIREFLRRRGITTSAGALAVTMAGLNAEALPAGLGIALGKIAVAGSGRAATRAVAVNGIKLTGGTIVMKNAAGIVIGTVLVVFAAWWGIGHAPQGPPAAPDAIETAETRAPVASASTNAIAPLEGASELAGATASPALETASPVPAAQGLKSFWPLLADPKAYAPEPLADPTKAAAVAGMVVDSSGRAISGAAVRLLLTGSGVPDASAIADAGPLAYTAHIARQNEVANDPVYQRASVSDDSGTFVFDDIRFTGSFTVSASADAYTRNSAAGTLEAESISEVIVTLDDGQAMYGKVITPSGLPVREASVASIGLLAKSRGYGSRPPLEALRERTDSEGNFTLWLKEPDKNNAWFTGLHIKSAKHGEGFFYPVAVDTKDRITIVLESQLARLSGTIRTADGAPARKHRIQVSGMDRVSYGSTSIMSPSSFFEAETSEDGGYLFQALPSLESFTAYVYTPDGTGAAIRPLPPLVAGEENTWDCTLDAPIQVTGEVRGLGSGNPLPGILVRYVSDDKDSNVSGLTYSDANGAFSFTVLSGAGDYTFRARYQRDGRTGINEKMETTVALRSGEEKFVLLEIPAPWSRTFQIVDQFGAPVPGVRGNVTLEFTGDGSSITSRLEVTDENGLVTFDLIDPSAAASYFLFRDGYIAANTESTESQPGEALPVEIFVLYQSADVVARLVDADGAPVANAKVTCEAAYAEGRSASALSATDAEGWVWIQGEIPGTDVQLHFSVEPAEGGEALEARIESTPLNPGIEHDLGEIVMAPAL